MEEFFAWSTLATYAGALGATMAVTQIFKGVGFIEKIPTRLFSWMVASVVLIAALYFTDALNWASAALSLVNGVVVSLAANGGYDLIKYAGTKLK